MGIIKAAKLNSTGRELVALHQNLKSAIAQVKQQKELFEARLDAINNNKEDFTTEDWQEVKELVEEVRTAIAEITAEK